MSNDTRHLVIKIMLSALVAVALFAAIVPFSVQIATGVLTGYSVGTSIFIIRSIYKHFARKTV